MNIHEWFEVKKINNHLYVIRERLDLVDDRFRTKYTNIFLIVGSTQCILFDTGSGMVPIFPLIQNIILDKYLVVINSHHHFDHIGGNSEFEEVHIHRFDFKPLMKPVDISFLKPKNHLVRQILENKKYRLQAAQIHRPLEGGEQYNLGHIKVEVVHTPGHTSGSICLLTDNGELFTGDTVHHGAIYLPSEDRIDNYLNSLTHLIRICQDRQVKSVYPAHEEYPIQIADILTLYDYILNRKHYAKRYDQPLDAWIIEKNQYSLIFPKEN